MLTATGERRAHVALKGLEVTLWFNTGPPVQPDLRALLYRPTGLSRLSAVEPAEYLDEIESSGLPTSRIGIRGEPFMNPELPATLEDALTCGFPALILTNAMKPMATI